MTRWKVTFEDEGGRKRSYVVDAASEEDAELMGHGAASRDSSWSSEPILKSAEAWTTALPRRVGREKHRPASAEWWMTPEGNKLRAEKLRQHDRRGTGHTHPPGRTRCPKCGV